MAGATGKNLRLVLGSIASVFVLLLGALYLVSRFIESEAPREPVSEELPDFTSYLYLEMTYSFDRAPSDSPLRPAGFNLQNKQHPNSFLPAVVIDIVDKVRRRPDYRLEPEDIASWETENGSIEPGSFVLLNTGWLENWRDRWLRGVETFPSLSEAAIRMLDSERGVQLIGADSPIIEHVRGVSDITVVQNIPKVDRLPPVGAYVLAGPAFKTSASEGESPPVPIQARVVAMFPPRP